MPVSHNSVESCLEVRGVPGVEASNDGRRIRPANAEDSVVLSDEEQALEILRKSVFGLWDVVNNLTRLTPTRRPEFRVSIFGSARIPRDHWVYAAVRDLARQLAQMGCAVITGGGPGLMEAANEGAALAGATCL